MKKYYNFFIVIICLIFTFFFIILRESIFDTIAFSLNMWIKTLVPSLFPFFIISDILINYNIIFYIPKKLTTFFKKIFKVNDASIIIFFLSILSGFPSNARNTKMLYDKKMISKEEASHILMFSSFSNPLFILGTLSIFFLNNKKLGIMILLAHYFSNFIIGIVLKPKYEFKNMSNINIKNTNLNFGLIFTKAIKNAIDSLLLILGVLTCFLITSTIILKIIPLNDNFRVLLKSGLEITMGLQELSLLKISDLAKVMLSASILSFGGLSIMMQVIAQISDTDISIKPYIIGRIYQMIISFILGYFFYYLFS